MMRGHILGYDHFIQASGPSKVWREIFCRFPSLLKSFVVRQPKVGGRPIACIVGIPAASPLRRSQRNSRNPIRWTTRNQ
jgi:hypothetical protein